MAPSDTAAVGETVELDVSGFAHGGFGVARDAGGRVVFVADAIPGERVRAVLTEAKKSFARASAVEILTASPDRVAHVWPEAAIDRAPEDRAGGAELGHVALPRQRALKREVLVDSLRRFGGLDPEALDAAADGGPLVAAAPGDDAAGGLGWRTRVRVHVDGAGRRGPFAARGHQVVRVRGLPLAAPEIQAVLDEEFASVEAVDAIATSAGLRLVIGDQTPSVIEERVGERSFRVDDRGFWQVHRMAPAVLVDAVHRAIDPARFDPAARNLDLYGGVGLLAWAIADVGGDATRVETVESDPRASAHAADNLARLPHAVATAASVDRWVRGADPGTFGGATIVLDPPRSGAGVETTAAIAGLGAAQLVYVACDPVALGRDARVLAEHGYRLTRIAGFDLFPHTHHLEAVATFVPAR